MIERKLFNIWIKTYYFKRDKSEEYSAAHLKGYSHSFRSGGSLRGFETLQFNLLKTEELLLAEMHKSTRRQVRRSAEENFEHIIIENPSDDDLLKFQSFYNRFAKNKKTCTCNLYHMETMKLLREKNALILTYIQGEGDAIYCYRVYIADNDIVMNLYSASHFRMVENTELKRTLGFANRFLIWKSILWFKERGYEIYDMGGLTNNENIRKFKMDFGGEVVTLYSGYEAESYFAKLILKLRNWKMAIGNVGNA